MVEEKNKDKNLKNESDGVDAFLNEGSTVTINGREYHIRRLGIRDTFKLARILAVGAAGMGKEIGKMDLSGEVVAGLLLVGFPYAEKQIMDFFADILGIKREELDDPDKFPMGSEVEIIEALVEHVDVKAFFDRVIKLLKAPMFKKLSREMST
jgi:hypothetical protein